MNGKITIKEEGVRGTASRLCVPNSCSSSTRTAEFAGVCRKRKREKEREKRETMAENADGKWEKSVGGKMWAMTLPAPETRLSACAAAAAAAAEAAKWHLRIQHLNGRQSGKPRQTRMISPVRQTVRTDSGTDRTVRQLSRESRWACNQQLHTERNV